MTTINEIKDRLNAVAFAGRSYAGADRVEELQTAITVAAAELADAAVSLVGTYAGNFNESLDIRLKIGGPIDKLVNIAQGTAISPEEAGE